MLIRPELQALRSNDAPQRAAQKNLHLIIEAWRTKDAGAQAEAELARFHQGQALSELPLLSVLFCPDGNDWRAFLDKLLQPLLNQIAEEPLGQSPLRFSIGDGFTSIVLARCGTSALTLQHVDGAALLRRPQAKTASFLPAVTWERVLVGTADATHVHVDQMLADRATLTCTDMRLAEGDVHVRSGKDEALILRSVPTSLVQLRLQRRNSTCEPVREYSLDDGRLLHQSAGTPRESRLDLTATLLGRMKRRDAAPMLAAMAEEQGADALRWQALRECLGLDSAIGFRTLCALADRAGDPLHRPATALRAKLLEIHPELNGVCPCPA